MKKIDSTVRRETLYITVSVVILSLLMESVFLIIGQWDYTVLLGNILSAFGAIANFFLMGLTVQTAVNKEQKHASDLMKLSQTLRMMLLLIITVVGVVASCFNTVAVIVPLFFPRIAITFRPIFNKKNDTAAQNNNIDSDEN